MKYAVITSKNEFGQIENLGRAILLNKMDERKHEERNQGFWEYRLVDNPSTTHCGWIDNSSIKEDI